MTDQARTSRVLIALIVSMTIGAVVLMALDNGALQGGAFSLSVFNRLPAIEDIVIDSASEKIGEWSRIEVFYSNTSSGNVKELTVLTSLTGNRDLDAHFVICNGKGGNQGDVQPTARWREQKPSLSGHGRTIRICIVADGVNTPATECQITRTDDLIKFFCKKFGVVKKNISRPASSQL